MGSIPYILPWVLVFLGIAGACAVKFLPFKSIAGIAVISVLALLAIGVGVYDNLISGEYEDLIAAEEAKVAKLEEWKYLHLDELSLIIAQQKLPEDEDMAILKKLMSYGWLRSQKDFKRFLDAAQALDTLKGERPDAERAIYLYKGIPESVDKTIVEYSLRTLGYKVIPLQEDEEALLDANVLYFGKYVEIEDVKLTALTLMRA
ncbi:MAG: hypothetical protein MI976_24250, partial [Pseudomonadales bacterium]|nr:hypothetical protein [Pseudomonadales bacterium]